jgi:two-component system chemotaxis response regulator CheY
MAKIMIVDDSLFMRNHLSKLLARNGYEIILAENGEQAVVIYRQSSPDAVLMDITMPRKDGLQALTEIREFDGRAKVIMLTALDQELAATRAIHVGAKDFLVKPVPPSRLLTALQRILRKVVLTGMGSDGTSGARRIKAAGGRVIAQDQATSAVYGMPRSVVEAGLADLVVPLPEMASTLLELIE